MYTLYIGNKNYSSWSLRAWVLMKAFGIPFNEHRITLYEPDSSERIRIHSPSGRLPCLHDGSTVVWDTLAIAEYLAERHPGMWPAAAGARAWARSAAAEMHSGYSGLRNEFGMNLRIRERRKASPAVESDIARIGALWREGRERFGQDGDFLCGAFGVVDAFYCPVAFRFESYGVALDDVATAYQRALLALPAMREWAAGASRETEHIEMLDRTMAQAQQQ
jgi:glutathione S-transferase